MRKLAPSTEAAFLRALDWLRWEGRKGGEGVRGRKGGEGRRVEGGGRMDGGRRHMLTASYIQSGIVVSHLDNRHTAMATGASVVPV